MNEATIAQTVMTVLILAIFVGFMVWGIKSGQFHHVEDAKYRMMESDKEEKTGGKKKPRRKRP